MAPAGALGHQLVRRALPEEMKELFIDLPEALENTVKIAEKCNLDLELGEFYLPDFDVPEGQTREEHLKQVSYEGLNKRILQINSSVNSCFKCALLHSLYRVLNIRIALLFLILLCYYCSIISVLVAHCSSQRLSLVQSHVGIITIIFLLAFAS